VEAAAERLSVVGADSHKPTHTLVAVDEAGAQAHAFARLNGRPGVLGHLAPVGSRGRTSTKTHHYAKDGDSPAWTDEGSGGYSRVISSIGGDIAAIRGVDATIEFQLANLGPF